MGEAILGSRRSFCLPRAHVSPSHLIIARSFAPGRSGLNSSQLLPQSGSSVGKTATSSGFRSVCILSLATAALGNIRSRELSLQNKGLGTGLGFGVQGTGRFMVSELEQHDCSRLLFYCEHSSSPVPFTSLKRCWGALPAGPCARGREMCLWREGALANVPLSALVPCGLAFDSPVFPSPSS